ncbi:MAG: redoxin family protein [Anaerolineaceae bacterium]|nr:redoxin family protein [Anaerolineaceae bacterium]
MSNITKSSLTTAFRERKMLVGIVLIGLVALAFIGLSQLKMGTGATAPTINQASTLPTINQAAASVSLTLPTIDGQTLALSGSTGHVSVLYVMGYWCGDCVAGAQALAHIQPQYAAQGVQFVGVDVTTGVATSDLQGFLQAVGENHLTWAMDTTGQFVTTYQINTLDTAIILDQEGREVYRNLQGASDTDIRAALDKLLAT